ncbi:MAG TPA: hypothetical protein VG389_09030, partial [Myxococcota bacterium]|nr:hypothetical protein [Myxococcota bacterium]
SYGVFLETGSTVDIDTSSFINDNGAAGGDGGVGGTSAPGFPANDGKTGAPGVIGPTAKQYTCASPASC